MQVEAERVEDRAGAARQVGAERSGESGRPVALRRLSPPAFRLASVRREEASPSQPAPSVPVQARPGQTRQEQGRAGQGRTGQGRAARSSAAPSLRLVTTADAGTTVSEPMSATGSATVLPSVSAEAVLAAAVPAGCDLVSVSGRAALEAVDVLRLRGACGAVLYRTVGEEARLSFLLPHGSASAWVSACGPGSVETRTEPPQPEGGAAWLLPPAPGAVLTDPALLRAALAQAPETLAACTGEQRH